MVKTKKEQEGKDIFEYSVSEALIRRSATSFKLKWVDFNA